MKRTSDEDEERREASSHSDEGSNSKSDSSNDSSSSDDGDGEDDSNSDSESPQYDKHGREILELGSFHNSELSSLTPYTEEEDDIDARLAALDKKLMIHSFRNLTLESLEGEDEKMEGNESEYLPQYIFLSNKGKQDLFGE
ncbi:hypothetical protein SO802_002771 [Lithocarpus litseifolius]|uniref:Uncharacterized protein n=1 Tax=Lithocarpus litseifolius TaxID=425828 RepID=A0AAW2DYQ5_9ROSI